ncbi:MAG TPA: sensor histidine kinase, partial [Magnetovibrio sp.]
GITLLILHGALEERRDADEKVRQARDELEDRVRERTADLHLAMQEAEEANRTKSRLLAAASHDLR